MVLMAKLAGTKNYTVQNIQSISFDTITDELITDCLDETISEVVPEIWTGS